MVQNGAVAGEMQKRFNAGSASRVAALPLEKRSRVAIGRLGRFCATFVLGRPSQELVAQLVEQRTFNAWVLGSIPSELTTPQAANPFKQSK